MKKKYADEIEIVRQDAEQQPTRILAGTFYQSSMTNASNNLQTQSKTIVAQTSATFMK